MSRLNTSAEVLHKLTEVGMMDDVAGGCTTTLSGSAAVGDAFVNVVSATSLIVGDIVRLGRTECCEVSKIETLKITFKNVLEYAHPSGEVFREIADVPIGETTTDGMSYESNTDETPMKIGTARGIYVYIPGSTEQTLTFSLLNFSLENLVEAFGLIPATRITGTGTVADPYIATINPSAYTEQPPRVWYAEGMREDLKIVRFEWWQTKIYSPQTTIKVTTGEATPIPMRLRCAGIVKVRMWA